MNETFNLSKPLSNLIEPLPPHYYLHNFRFLIEWVAERYKDLMDEQELAFIESFYQLERDAQCLLVRLIGRKGPWFRANKLAYAEIENHHQAGNQLIDAKLISNDSELSILELSAILTKSELLLIFCEQLNFYKAERKEVLIQLLSDSFPTHKTWSQWTNNQLGDLYHLDIQSIVSTLLLLFFGNPYQDLTEFVLQDLGLFRYEEYTIDPQHRIFKRREEMVAYQNLLQLREHLAEAVDINSLEQLALRVPHKFESATMERRRARLLHQLAYEFERYGELNAAMGLYQQTNLPPSRERQIRLLEKSGNHPQAWELLEKLIAMPQSEHELQIAQRMAPRLSKKIGVTFYKKSVRKIVEKYVVLEQSKDEYGDLLGVEEIVRRYFSSEQAPCLYVENELLNSLFGLWLWPEMFRSIDGAFANPFQTAPLDLYQDSFQHSRPALQQLWQLLDEQAHSTHIKNIWQQKNGIANHFVSWKFIDEHILQLALQCIPAQHLKCIFQRLMFDLKTNRSGFPDLIQFFPDTNSYRMIEVKGPGDRIQDNQQRWLDFFGEHNIPAEVCYVSWK